MEMTSARQDIELSLSELRMLALKAARGAGMSWGLAEEAGFAAEWLTARGLPGGAWLAALLRRGGAVIPAWPDGARAAGPHCPIRTGAALADHALVDGDTALPRDLKLPAVVSPGLLLPFLDRLAALRNGPVTVGVGSGRITLPAAPGSGALAQVRDWSDEPQEVVLSIADCGPGGTLASSPASRARAFLAAADLECLTGLASRLTVPATTRSRGDAGSAMSDND